MTLIANEREYLHVALEGRVSKDNSEPGRDSINILFGPLGFTRKVLVDMSKTTYIDSSGIGWLVVCHKKFEDAKGKLILHSIPPRVYQVLDVIGLPKIMHVAPDEATARAMAMGENQ
jgi:stage II sporulation protein AA (anti-sigma F factor antagonist)